MPECLDELIAQDNPVRFIDLFGKDTVYVPVIMYGNPRYPLQQIPDVQQSTPYHRFGRVKRKQAKVTGEVSLSYLAYNFVRAVNIIGVPGILAHYSNKNVENKANMGLM